MDEVTAVITTLMSLVKLWFVDCAVMGIHGLLPYVKKASRQSNIKEFKGCTVAIDSYCWLHRGAFACAEKLALGEKTDQ